MPQTPIHWGRRKIPVMSQVLQYSTFAPEETLGSNMGAPSLVLARAQSNFGTPLEQRSLKELA